MRYLDINCPANQVVDKLAAEQDAISRKYREGTVRTAAEHIRQSKKADKLLMKYAANDMKIVDQLTDKDYIWPESVRTQVAEMAAATTEEVSATREFVRGGGFEKLAMQQDELRDRPWKQAQEKSAEKASAIRSALRLPPRREGCKDGKRSLTMDQIKKLQG